MFRMIGCMLLVCVWVEAKTYEVCTSEYPPYEYTKDGKVTGMDVETVRNVFAKMGDKVEIFMVPWKRCENMASAGQVDGIMSMSYSTERAKYAYFSQPISQIRDVFFKRKSSDISWEKMEDLKAYRVGVSGGYSYAPDFRQAVEKGVFKSVESVNSGTPEYQNLKKLVLNRIDLFICEQSVCSYMMGSHSEELYGLDYIDRPIGPVRTFHIGFSKAKEGGKELQERFDQALKLLE